MRARPNPPLWRTPANCGCGPTRPSRPVIAWGAATTAPATPTHLSAERTSPNVNPCTRWEGRAGGEFAPPIIQRPRRAH